MFSLVLNPTVNYETRYNPDVKFTLFQESTGVLEFGIFSCDFSPYFIFVNDLQNDHNKNGYAATKFNVSRKIHLTNKNWNLGNP